MKLFGKEFEFNGWDIWHKGNFTPSKVATSNNYNDLNNKPTIPTTLPANGGTADAVNFLDTRSDADKPSALSSRKLTCMFKSKTSVENPPVGASGTYVFVLNIVGWSSTEGSGGWPIQLAVGAEGLAYRQSTNADTWGAWIKISNTKDIPLKLSQFTKDINFDERYYTENEVDTKLSAKSDTSHNHNTSYLGINSKATDSAKLNGQTADYYLNYNNFSNKPTIPTKMSQLTNDIGAGGGTNIVPSPSEPPNLKEGDWWFKEL